MPDPAILLPLWDEGLLLYPQHLQQSTRYHEALLDARLRALRADPWGVEDLAFDPGALAAGSLRLTRLRVVLPDGTPLTLADDGIVAPESRPIAPHFPASATTLTVHLALPELRGDTPNVVRDASPAPPRFRVVTRTLADVARSAAARSIDLIAPAPRLLFAGEPLGGQVVLPLAELRRAPEGGFALVDAFVPPLLTLGGSSWLRNALADLLALAITRWRALRAECARRRGAPGEIDPRDLGRHILLQTLGRAIPRLAHLGESVGASPRDLFECLVGLAGELALFVGESDPSALPPYRHGDLRSTFAPLLAELRAQIQAALRVDCIDLGLTPQGDGIWVTELADERLRRCGAVYVTIARAGADDLTADGVADLVKLAAWRRIQALVRGNSRGAPLRPALRPPAALPLADDDLCFAVDTRDPHWREVLEERSLAILLSAPCDPRRARVRALAIPTCGGALDGLGAANEP